MRGLLFALLAAMVLPAQAPSAQEPADLFVRHASIVDVEHARTVSDQAIVTRAQRIVAVGADAAIVPLPPRPRHTRKSAISGTTDLILTAHSLREP